MRPAAGRAAPLVAGLAGALLAPAWPSTAGAQAPAPGPAVQAPAPGPAVQAPAQAAPPAVRPVPPKGISVPEADRRVLEAELSTLAQEMKRLRERPELVPLLPDVEIFYRAVDGAFRHGEFFAEEELAAARQLLAAGRERARAVASGKTPWLDQPGPTVLGYVSRLDGSVQPYGLYLPDGFRPQDGRRWRLDVWFHGRGEKLSELAFVNGVTRKPPEFAGPHALLLQPYGRYCNGSKLAGEVDFWEALADVERRFAVDQDRIVIRGFSLGGHSAWHLGAHFASRWAAVAPGAGFAESPAFLRMFEKDKLEPTWWEEKLWQLYDAPAYADNFRNVPVVAYSGDKDRQKQAADLMAEVLGKVGIDLVHVIGPETGHSYHPAAKATINRTVDELAARGRDPLPRRVALRTPTLKYNRQAWLQVDGLVEHWTPAHAEGELRGEGQDAEIRVRTTGVTALSLLVPTGAAPFFPGQPPRVVIDGQRVAGPQLAQAAQLSSDRSFTARFHRQNGRWKTGAPPDDGRPRKRHDLQGPIDDAFMGSFLFVAPSGKPLSGDVGAWTAAEQARAIREWRRQFRGEPRVRQDKVVTAEDIAEHNLVLWGDPGSNAVLARLADKLPIQWTKDGISAGKQRFGADTHALIAVYPNPLNPERYVVLNSGFTFREYDYLNNARQTPKLPDWAVIDTSTKPDARWPGKVVAADFFGERWELRPPHKAARGGKP
jgi:hypothetical protein